MSVCALDVNNGKKDQAAAHVEDAFKGGGENNVLNALDILKSDTKSICPQVDGVNTMGYIGQKLSDGAKQALAPFVPELELYDDKKSGK